MQDEVETAVADGHRYIELNRDAAVGYELLGRAAKYRGEAEWQELLKLAADRYAVEGRMQDLPSAANLYRPTGHSELAHYMHSRKPAVIAHDGIIALRTGADTGRGPGFRRRHYAE